MDLNLDRGSFALMLRRFRLEAQMSQEELAERAHLSPESISALERGRRRATYRETIQMLAQALGLSATQRQELAAEAQRPRTLSKNTIAYDSAIGANDSATDPPNKARHNLPITGDEPHRSRGRSREAARAIHKYAPFDDHRHRRPRQDSHRPTIGAKTSLI
jgi:transcriptional regulator with XRE-family HTH domain